MQTGKDVKNKKPSKKEGYQNQKANNPHFVYITDENAIVFAFEEIKYKLSIGIECCLTLFYSIHNQPIQPLFKSELEILERRFPSQLLVYYVINENGIEYNNSDIIQQTIEVIINSNISDCIRFFLSGSTEFIESITEHLHFLDIKSNQISI